MLYKEILPAKQLQTYIKCYWVLENPYPAGTIEEVLPQSCYELLYQRKQPYRLAGKELPKLTIISLLDTPMHLQASDTALWAVRFLPWGLSPFGNTSVLTRKNLAFDASRILHAHITKELIQELPSATTATFASTLDNIFLQALLVWHFDDHTIQRLAEHLRAVKGSVTVAELAQACFRSVRQTERTLVRATGSPPREVLARLRFEQVWRTIAVNPTIDLSQLALDCGYADQSHMSREFKRLAQITPKALSRQVKDSNIATNPNVAFMQ